MNVSKSLIIIVVLMFSTFAICDEQKSKEKKVEVDVNTYLGILIQKLDLTKDKIIIHVFNINETKIKASFSKTHLEGRIIVKTPTQVKVFVHKKWNDFQLTSIGFHKPEMLEKGQIIEYKDSLDKYIDLHGKTNLKEFLNQNKAEELYIKVIGSPYRVSPPFQNGATPSSRELEGSWQKIKLSTPEKMDKRFFKVRSAFISKIVSKNGTHEEKKLYEDSDWNDDLFENKINQSIEKKRQVCNKVLLRYFIDEGIGFSESTSLDYSARSGKLTVTNTPSNLNLLDKFLMDNDYELPQVLYFIDFLVMDEKLDHPVNLFRHGPGKYISKIFDESSIRIPTSIFGPSPVILKNQKSAIKHIQKTTDDLQNGVEFMKVVSNIDIDQDSKIDIDLKFLSNIKYKDYEISYLKKNESIRINEYETFVAAILEVKGSETKYITVIMTAVEVRANSFPLRNGKPIIPIWDMKDKKTTNKENKK